MRSLALAFRDHVLATDIPNCTIKLQDEHHITLTTPDAVGEVNFYCMQDSPEIVELRISDADCPDNPKFFLHFEMDDEKRAEELFAEMATELQQEDLFDTTRVLLCCTTGMTTSLFAAKLTEAAEALSLDYRFDVMPLEEAQAKGGDYDAVLLAPQVGYQRKATADVFPKAVVVQIPPKIFASFDAGGALKMVMHLLSDNTVFPTEDSNDLKLVRDISDDHRIMVISAVNRRRSTWLGWRIYDHGEPVAHGSVTKRLAGYRDIEDLLATLHVSGWNVSDLDAVGIAMPGVVNRGTIDFWATPDRPANYDLGRSLSERYGVKVFVDNNANAAAVGCYVSQESYDTLVLHTQQTGYLVGGQGIVVDGHLAKGRRNYAGELEPLFETLYASERDEELEHDLAWTPEGMLKLVARMLVADVALLAPDAIYVAVDLVDDMDALREEMAKYFPAQEDYLPELVRVIDYRERIALGELALCLQKLHNPRPHRKH